MFLSAGLVAHAGKEPGDKTPQHFSVLQLFYLLLIPTVLANCIGGQGSPAAVVNRGLFSGGTEWGKGRGGCGRESRDYPAK